MGHWRVYPRDDAQAYIFRHDFDNNGPGTGGRRTDESVAYFSNGMIIDDDKFNHIATEKRARTDGRVWWVGWSVTDNGYIGMWFDHDPYPEDM